MSDGVFEFLDRLGTLDSFSFALQNGIDDVLELLQLGLQLLLASFSARRVDPVRGSAKLLLEGSSNGLNGCANERLVLEVVTATVGEGLERVQDLLAYTTGLVRRVESGESTQN